MGFSIHDPCIQEAIRRGLIRREDIEPLPIALPEAAKRREARKRGEEATSEKFSEVAPAQEARGEEATSEKFSEAAPTTPTRWLIGLDIAGVNIISEMNSRCHWAARARRFKAQAAAVRQALSAAHFIAPPPFERCTITLTRVGRRQLDDDNLASGFKAVRDTLADWLGVDDGSERLTWSYTQERGQPGIRITIEGNAPCPKS